MEFKKIGSLIILMSVYIFTLICGVWLSIMSLRIMTLVGYVSMGRFLGHLVIVICSFGIVLCGIVGIVGIITTYLKQRKWNKK